MVIQANDLSRTYQIRKKKAGLPGAVLGLFKTEYLEKRAIDHLSFTMEEGEALACIGENGAGKSTLIKMLVGILQPTSGSVLVMGQDPMKRQQAYLRKIGVVFGQKTNLWLDIPVEESYNAMRTIYQISSQVFEKNKRQIVDMLDLGPILQSPARKLSLDQRMKADIGLVLLHKPRLLFLDEPTIGLDINVKHTIRSFIRQMNQEEGVSVLLTSHDLDDIEQICDTALVLQKGKSYYCGSLRELKERFACQKVITITGTEKRNPCALYPDLRLEREGRKTTILFEAHAHTMEDVLAHLLQCYEVQDVSIQEPGIDDVVAQIFGRKAE